MYWIFTFPTTHLAIKFEQIAKKEKCSVQLTSLPRKISSSCGYCGKVTNFEELDKLMEVCDRYGIQFEHIYEILDDTKEEPLLYK